MLVQSPGCGAAPAHPSLRELLAPAVIKVTCGNANAVPLNGIGDKCSMHKGSFLLHSPIQKKISFE